MWPKNKRRNPHNATKIVAHAISKLGAPAVARAAGVSYRTVRRWESGEDYPNPTRIIRILDAVLDKVNKGALPIYSSDMAIDGYTRVGGVGKYSREAARGNHAYIRTQITATR